MEVGLQSMFYKAVWGHNAWSQARAMVQNKHAELVCCRRDSAALQCLILDENDFLLTTAEDPIFWKGGPLEIVRIEAALDGVQDGIAVQTNLIGMIEDDDRCLKADLLMEACETYVEGGKAQPVWIELHTDEHTPPGEYPGTVRMYAHTMFEDERLVGECTFTLTVKEMLLPNPGDYRFYLDLWQHSSNIARKYEAKLWSDDHFNVLDHYMESLGQLGQKVVSLVVSEIPWSGQFSHRDRKPSNFFEYNIVRIVRASDGRFHYDFSALDRYVRLAEKHGICAEIELFGLLNIWQDRDAGYGSVVEGDPDGIRLRYLDEASGTYRFIRDQEQLEHYIRALEAHLSARGWIERVRVMADEPGDVELFQVRLQRLRLVAPSFRYKVAVHHAAFIRQGIQGICDYAPVLTCVGSEYEKLTEHLRSKTGRTLYYVACNPDKPNTFLGSPPLESRLMPWLAEKLGLDGFLRWSYTAWPDDPLHSLSYRAPLWKAGDTSFVYPGASGRPQLSLRYKWLQRGIRDYELMQLMKADGREEVVASALEAVIKFAHPRELHAADVKKASELYSLDVADYERLVWAAK